MAISTQRMHTVQDQRMDSNVAFMEHSPFPVSYTASAVVCFFLILLYKHYILWSTKIRLQYRDNLVSKNTKYYRLTYNA